MRTQTAASFSGLPAPGGLPPGEARCAATMDTMMLTLLEKLLLLHVQSRRGRGSANEAAMGPVVAGAALLDLTLAGRVDADAEHVFVTDAAPTGDAILDSVLGFVAAGTAGVTADEWVLAICGLGPHLRRCGLVRLEERGFLVHEGGWVPMGGPEDISFALTPAAPMAALRAEMRAVLLGTTVPDAAEVILIGLADACEVLDAVLSFEELADAMPRIRQIARMDRIGQAISAAVLMVRAAVLGEEELRVSMSALVNTSSLLGQKLEDRASIRRRQDGELVLRMQKASSTYVGDLPGHTGFFVAPMDVLVGQDGDARTFQMTELNGTGIGGLTNISDWAVRAILDDFRALPATIGAPLPLIVVANSTKAGGPNPMIYEKILYSDALIAGFGDIGVPAQLVPLDDYVRAPEAYAGVAVVVLGYMDAFMKALAVEEGQLVLGGRKVSGAINDRFVLNLRDAFGADAIERPDFFICNFCYEAGADKAVAYRLANAFLDAGRARGQTYRFVRPRINFALAHNPQDLRQTVRRFLDEDCPAVIKPCGTGHGHGIEFLFPGDSAETINERIADSFAAVRRNYGGRIDGFPYTVCEFIDTAMIRHPEHPHFGHKYELRVVVYREGTQIKAFPSIAKISSQRFNAGAIDRLMLINNVTTSSAATRSKGADFVLPLSCAATLELFEITEEQLTELCRFATGYVRHVIAAEYRG